MDAATQRLTWINLDPQAEYVCSLNRARLERQAVPIEFAEYLCSRLAVPLHVHGPVIRHGRYRHEQSSGAFEVSLSRWRVQDAGNTIRTRGVEAGLKCGHIVMAKDGGGLCFRKNRCASYGNCRAASDR